MAEQKTLEWYEYDEAEMQISVLQGKIDEAQNDLESYELSAFSRNAILNEVQRHNMFIADIKEQMGEEDV